MDPTTVDEFIANQRKVLHSEKERVGMNGEKRRYFVGILPSDSSRNIERERLRKEQREEYVAHMKEKENAMPISRRGLKSISEIRQEMAEQRERELSQNDQTIAKNRYHPKQKREDEVHVTASEQGSDWDRRNNTDLLKQRRQNDACASAYQHRSWDEEEGGLRNWLRGQSGVQSSTNNQMIVPSESIRSVSAPLSATGLIVPSFLQRDNTALQRQRQQEYAEALRQQMREKKRNVQREHERRGTYSDDYPSLFQQNLPSSQEASAQKREAISTYNNQYNTEDELGKHHYHWPLNQQNQESYPYHKDPRFQPMAPQPFPHSDFMRQFPSGPYPYLPYYFPYPYPSPLPPASYDFYPPSVGSHNTFLPSSLRNSTRASRVQHISSINTGDEIEREQQVKSQKEVRFPYQPNAMYDQEKRKLGSEEYRTLLDQQVSERKEKLSKDKEQREKLIRMMEESEYNPWGRPGGGAPVRNEMGKVVTERGRINQSFDNLSPRMAPTLSEEEVKKKQQEEHATDLIQQIEAKKRKQVEERQKQKQQEIAEELRLQRERQKLNQQHQSEMENEAIQKDQSAVGVKTETKNPTPVVDKGELVRLKYEEEMQKKRAKQKEEQERLDRLAEKMATLPQPVYPRSTSPPIPTIKSRHIRASSPPVSTPRHTRASSPPVPAPRNLSAQSEVRNGAHPYMHLDDNPSGHSQQPHTQGIHSLQDQAAAQPVFPAVIQSEPLRQSTTSSSPEVQIIPSITSLARDNKQEKVLKILGTMKEQVKQVKQHIPSDGRSAHKMSGPVVARPSGRWQQLISDHTHDESDAVKAFTDLKYKDASASRMEFWKQYPQPPRTTSALELQQNALLSHQSKELDRASKHASQEIHQVYKSRRKTGAAGYSVPRPISPGSFSQQSVATLDIEALAARNEERARRLESILNAGTGEALNEDPQDILHSFMERDQHKQLQQPLANMGVPPLSALLPSRNSETSLDCETTFQPLPSSVP